jgi:spermidine synthase
VSAKKKHPQATDRPQKTKGSALSTKHRRIAVAAFAFSGMAALMYEVLWTRELSLVFGSTVYAVSMMLASFMSGLSLGAWLGGKWADRSDNLLMLFGKLEFGIAVFGLLSLPLVQVLPSAYFLVYDSFRPTFGLFFGFQLLLSFLIMLVPTTFMGATFPVVSKINTAALDELGTDVGNVYSINTLGSIAGSLLTGFVLIPLIGVKATTFVAAILNLAVSLTMFAIARKLPKPQFVAIASASLLVAGGVALFTTQAAFAHNFYRIGDFTDWEEYEQYRDSLVTELFEDDVHGRVVVAGIEGGGRYLQNSGKVEGSDQPIDRQTTSLLALLPIMAAQDPHSALVVGLGTGFTTKAALDAGLAEVDTVEINRSVLDASRLFVGDAIESDSRSEIFVTDARNYLNTTKRTYDVVTSEPSYPLSTHVSHLFTKEFYSLVRSRLSQDGVFCQWIPRYLLTDEDTLMMLKTFQQVFPQVYVWGSNQGENEAIDMMLIGVNGSRELDADEINAAVRATASGQALDFGYFAGPEEVAASVTDPEIPVNTDDLPHLEFRAPRNQIEFYRQGLEGLRGR